MSFFSRFSSFSISLLSFPAEVTLPLWSQGKGKGKGNAVAEAEAEAEAEAGDGTSPY